MLNYKICKLIKPTGAKDDYLAGEGAEFGPTLKTIKLGQEYRKAVYDFLLVNGASTISTMAIKLNIKVKALCSIIQKMRRSGALKQGDKSTVDCKQLSFTYLVA